MIDSVVRWHRPGVVDGRRLGADIMRVELDGLRPS
jgi:hypothetical protein